MGVPYFLDHLCQGGLVPREVVLARYPLDLPAESRGGGRVFFPRLHLRGDRVAGSFQCGGEVGVGLGYSLTGPRFARGGLYGGVPDGGRGARERRPAGSFSTEQGGRVPGQLGVEQGVRLGVLAEGFPVGRLGGLGRGVGGSASQDLVGVTQVIVVASESGFLNPLGQVGQGGELVFGDGHGGVTDAAGAGFQFLYAGAADHGLAKYFRSGRRAVPTRLANAHSGVRLQILPVLRNRHRTRDLPLTRVVVEAPKGRLRAGGKSVHVGKASGHGNVEVGCSIGLHGDYERHLEAFRQGLGQPIRGYRSYAYAATRGPVVRLERSRRYGDGGGLEKSPLLGCAFFQVAGRQGDLGLGIGIDGLQSSFHNLGQVYLSVLGIGLVSTVLVVDAVAGRGNGVAWYAFPCFADYGIVVPVSPFAVGCLFLRGSADQTTVHVHEKTTGGSRGQFEVAVRSRQHVHLLLVPDHRDEGPGKRGVSFRVVRVVDPTFHRSVRVRSGYPYARKHTIGDSTALTVAVRVYRATQHVAVAVPIESHFYFRIGRPTVIVQEERGLQAIRRQAGGGHVPDGARFRVKGVPADHRTFLQGHAESDHELAGQRYVAFALVRRCRKNARQGQGANRLALETEVEGLLHVVGVDQAVPVHVRLQQFALVRNQVLLPLDVVHHQHHVHEVHFAVVVEVTHHQR